MAEINTGEYVRVLSEGGRKCIETVMKSLTGRNKKDKEIIDRLTVLDEIVENLAQVALMEHNNRLELSAENKKLNKDVDDLDEEILDLEETCD